MRTFVKRLSFIAAALLVFAAPAQWEGGSGASAATANITPAISGVLVLPIHISGQVTATVANVVQFTLPFAAKVLGVSVTARASGGTSPTLTVMVEDDGVDILTGAISITAGTVSEGALIATPVIADESEITIDLVIGGSSPTWDDITVLTTLIRR